MYVHSAITLTATLALMLCYLDVIVRLNTRCHLLAFAAKVEKQLQATVSIQ